jgi:RNA polymerase sigma-70 factor (ECF subfamily)
VYDSTRWSLIRKAAQGLAPDREDFARVYEPVARAYYIVRWKGSPHMSDVDDAVQVVLLDCLKEHGALTRADETRPGGFRAFFYGILRKTALVTERKRLLRREVHPQDAAWLDSVPADDPGLSTAFDRAWAQAILREAVERHHERAEESGPAALRRWELLRLRFREGLPIREIAARWGEEAKTLHDQQRQAKKEFQAALSEVVRFHHPACADLAGECRQILQTFS